MEYRKNGRKTSTVICKSCGKSFEKANSEIKRTEAKSANHYCSISCSARDSIEVKMGDHFKSSENIKYLKKPNGEWITRSDEFIGFREFIRRAKKRNKLGDLTLEDLKEQWEKQSGICPYTGINLILPSVTKEYTKINLASLDRIDSNKGYERENIMFVSVAINYMKNTMSEEETVELCKIIAKFWNNK